MLTWQTYHFLVTIQVTSIKSGNTTVIETIFLIIALNGDIHIKEGPDTMFRHDPIPQSVVKECTEWSGVNPYNAKEIGNAMNELLFLECVYYDMGDHEHAII